MSKQLSIILFCIFITICTAIPVVEDGSEGFVEELASSDPSRENIFKSPQCKAAATGIKWKRRIGVGSSAALQKALNGARSGDVIELAPGIYSPRVGGSRLTIKNKRGTKESPIVICGPRAAIISENGGRDAEIAEIVSTLEPRADDGRPDSVDESTLNGALSLVDVSYVYVRGLKYTGSEIGIIMNRVNKVRVMGAWVYRTERSGIACKNCEHSSILNTDIDKAFRGKYCIVLFYPSKFVPLLKLKLLLLYHVVRC